MRLGFPLLQLSSIPFENVTSVNVNAASSTVQGGGSGGSGSPLAQGAGTAAAESVFEAATRINSHLMKREAPMELTPALLRHLHHDLPWKPVVGPSLVRLLRLPLFCG